MRHTYVCTLCGQHVVLYVRPSCPPVCSNKKHREARVMQEVGDPASVTRRALQMLAGIVPAGLAIEEAS